MKYGGIKLGQIGYFVYRLRLDVLMSRALVRIWKFVRQTASDRKEVHLEGHELSCRSRAARRRFRTEVVRRQIRSMATILGLAPSFLYS